ncbi:hypothetical protein N431DRAFT_438695 [Stipitochalara longipes BDJ]|nr:hypothetical protein N431DRAFT_438695 [Stipitochalara longipes BDJ]
MAFCWAWACMLFAARPSRWIRWSDKAVRRGCGECLGWLQDENTRTVLRKEGCR